MPRNLDNWIRSDLPQVAQKLEEKVRFAYKIESDEEITIAGRDNLYKTLNDILAALFPGNV